LSYRAGRKIGYPNIYEKSNKKLTLRNIQSPVFDRSEARSEPVVVETPESVSIIWDSSRSRLSPEAVMGTLNHLPDTTPEEARAAAQLGMMTTVRVGSSLKRIDSEVVQDFIRRHQPVIGLSRWDYQLTPQEIIVYDSKGSERARTQD